MPAPPTKKRVEDMDGRGQAARAPIKNPRAMPAQRLQRGMGTPLKTRVRSGMRWHTRTNILSKRYPSGPRGKVALAMGSAQGNIPAKPKLPRARRSGQCSLTAGATGGFYLARNVLPRSSVGQLTCSAELIASNGCAIGGFYDRIPRRSGANAE